ncbi:SPFH domain-containing protein, partial [Klebsiella aerogenes]|uniref:SPFH domain-containing protein n=1 Tax=Klebsiella aerogenes TaxID=548 RepID=UPI001CC44822
KSTITLSFQFSVNPTNLPLLHKYVGAKYYETVVLPNIQSATRDIVAKYGSAEAFTKELQKIEETISLDTTNVILNKISPPGLD